jgi:phosphatidate cytidylyltransferase
MGIEALKLGADFLPRLGSTVILAPAVLLLLVWGGWPFILLILATAVAILWEWLTMTAARPKPWLLAVGGGVLAAAALMLAIRPPSAAIGLVLLGMVAMTLVARGGRQLRPWSPAGLFYAAAFLVPVLVLRADPQLGLLAMLWLLAVVWSTDIAAYFCGRLLGGPKLWPRVSPNKTWSGALGGTLFGTLAGMLVLSVAGVPSVWLAAPAALVVSVVSQGGDLFESAMKRRFGIKDSSRLIPGHGGLMDRLDGLITAAAFALLLGILRDPSAPAAGLLVW